MQTIKCSGNNQTLLHHSGRILVHWLALLQQEGLSPLGAFLCRVWMFSPSLGLLESKNPKAPAPSAALLRTKGKDGWMIYHSYTTKSVFMAAQKVAVCSLST